MPIKKKNRNKKIKKLTEQEYIALLVKNNRGIELTIDEWVACKMFEGLSEQDAREALFVGSDEYKNQNKYII